MTQNDAAPDSAAAFLTISEFCQRNRLSRSTLFKLRKGGLGPRVLPFAGGRISLAGEAEWRLAMEAAADADFAKLAHQRRSERMTIAGRKAAASPRHNSKRAKRGSK